MIQQAAVIFIVAACGVFLAVQVYRFVRPKPGGKGCAGGCCDGQDTGRTAGSGAGKALANAGAVPGRRGTMMISSDDLRARLAARKK